MTDQPITLNYRLDVQALQNLGVGYHDMIAPAADTVPWLPCCTHSKEIPGLELCRSVIQHGDCRSITSDIAGARPEKE